MLILAGLPAFLAEAKFSGDRFRLFLWRSPETRMQLYLETVLAREDHVKEVKLFGLGPLFLERYRNIFRKLYHEDRDLTIRRDTWGFLLGLIATATLYGAYAWIALSAIATRITLGQMTMYLMLFRQGQVGRVGDPVRDRRHVRGQSVSLDAVRLSGNAGRACAAARSCAARCPTTAFASRMWLHLSRMPSSPTLVDVNLHIRPGESLALVGENGSGKTTLIKLLTRLYRPTSGRILLDGQDLRDWDEAALRDRIGVIFQDFTRYQLLLGENIGAGDVQHFEDEARWREAGEKGMAAPIVAELPEGYRTPLGKWFNDGRELSGGQWQKIALSRAFMRSRADILVLDEPTAAMDAGAEATILRTLPRADQRPHRDPDLASLLDRAHGRPDRRASGRAHHRARQPRSADAAERPLRAPVLAAGEGIQVREKEADSG